MSELFHSYQPYGPERIGRVEEVLVTERATDGVHLVGHNKAYEQILVPPVDRLMGRTVRVKIVGVTKFSMKAELFNDYFWSGRVSDFLKSNCWPLLLVILLVYVVFSRFSRVNY